jgi:sugar phosphate isomerase/epimerase
MNKIGVFTDDLASEFPLACELAVQAGVDALAVRNVGGRNVVEADQDEVRGIASLAKASGLEIASVGSQFGREFYLDSDTDQQRAEAIVQRALGHAEILDTPLVRIFALWLPGQEPLAEWQRRPNLEQVLDDLVSRLRPSVKLAERAGATLMIELEGASYAGTVGEARTLIEALDSPAVALCWDVCNGWWSGEDPWKVGYPEALELPIVDVQTKDVPARIDDPRQPSFGRAVVGQGDVGYPTIIPALIAAGYQGYFTVERVHHPHRPEQEPLLQQATLADIAELKAIVARAGEASLAAPDGKGSPEVV